MNIYTVSFFGHRVLSDGVGIEKCLDRLVRELIHTKEYVDFLVGRNGDFDILVSSVIHRVIAELDYGNASLILVLPYMTAKLSENADCYKSYYTEVEICECSASAYFRDAIQIRNRAMVERSDLVVCCIEHNSGGAFKTIKYAENLGKRVVNLYSEI